MKVSLSIAAILFMLLIPSVGLFAQETATEPPQQVESIPVTLTTVDSKTTAELKPENTKVEFVGTHVGDDPKPRLGGFKSFKGAITIDNDKPVSVNVEFEIGSIWTEFDNLTKHLMNEDFFEVETFPAASFQSTSVNDLGDGKCLVTGDLTLHGTTGEFEFVAKYQLTDTGLILNADFKLDRTRFGMDKMTDGVEKDVSLNVVVGQATRGAESKDGNGNDDSDDQASNEGGSANSVAMDTVSLKINLPNMT